MKTQSVRAAHKERGESREAGPAKAKREANLSDCGVNTDSIGLSLSHRGVQRGTQGGQDTEITGVRTGRVLEI